MAASQKKLLDHVREVLRKKHYSLRTEESYIDQITRYVRFHQLRHPREQPGLLSRPAATPSGTVSRPTCSRMSTIFAPFRSYSGTPMYVRR
jgi:hypothetical protein